MSAVGRKRPLAIVRRIITVADHNAENDRARGKGNCAHADCYLAGRRFAKTLFIFRFAAAGQRTGNWLATERDAQRAFSDETDLQTLSDTGPRFSCNALATQSRCYRQAGANLPIMLSASEREPYPRPSECSSLNGGQFLEPRSSGGLGGDNRLGGDKPSKNVAFHRTPPL